MSAHQCEVREHCMHKEEEEVQHSELHIQIKTKFQTQQREETKQFYLMIRTVEENAMTYLFGCEIMCLL